MENTMKRTLSILLTLAILLSTAVFPSAAKVVESGKCGYNLFYEFFDNGELIITGTGDMFDYEWYGSPFFEKINIKKLLFMMVLLLLVIMHFGAVKI